MSILVDKTVIFFAEFPWKKKSSVPSEGLLVLFLSKSVNTMTSAENQLYRFNYCLALMLETIYFEMVFTEHWRRSFWLSFLIICRWNLFRTICANSRKVGLGKFFSPYKDIVLSRIPVTKGINSALGWTKYRNLYEIVHLSLILISLCLLTGV